MPVSPNKIGFLHAIGNAFTIGPMISMAGSMKGKWGESYH